MNPHINSMSLNPESGSDPLQVINIYGSGFLSSPAEPVVVLTWTGMSMFMVPAAAVNVINSGFIQITITAGSAADNWTARVINADGQVSNASSFSSSPANPD